MGQQAMGDGAYSYAASKASVHHLTRILAKELAAHHSDEFDVTTLRPPFKWRAARLPVIGKSSAAKNLDRLLNRMRDQMRWARRRPTVAALLVSPVRRTVIVVDPEFSVVVALLAEKLKKPPTGVTVIVNVCVDPSQVTALLV